MAAGQRTAFTNIDGPSSQPGQGTSMRYSVEVAIHAADFGHELAQMRTWLDHMNLQAIGFRKILDKNICRIDFASEQEARGFAKAFAGQMLDRSTA